MKVEYCLIFLSVEPYILYNCICIVSAPLVGGAVRGLAYDADASAVGLACSRGRVVRGLLLCGLSVAVRGFR